MIPASLMLILVAVALLALGLTSGSSGLLIASIVASLLAAIALVIGARRTAGMRRPAAGRPASSPADPAAAAPARSEAFADAEPPAEGPSPQFAAEFAAAQAAADPGEYPTAEHPAARDERLDADLDDDLPWRSTGSAFATQPIDEPEVAAATGGDYDRASSAIHGARSEQPDANAWHRDTHAEAAAAQELPDEFADADADDPDDEPLPQSVQPADAVRVARMDAEVLVVDGRPRYHLADCAHLVGRLTEPIPVNEAVELGFSPCGLCRPVDRLVAADARR